MEVYRYTDAQALEEGVLVDISGYRLVWLGRPINRMTKRLFETLSRFAAKGFGVKKMLATKLRYIRPTDDPGHFILPPNLWLRLNDTGGWTIMFPEDD
jgi:hypothetical protein